jgi:TRAP transporter TAXI family solute receptor
MTPAKQSAFHHHLLIWGPITLVVVVAMVITWVFLVGPPPPKHIRFAAGSPGGAYVQFADSYKHLLANKEIGIDMEVVETHGSIDNLKLLKDPGNGVVAALVQGGVVPSPSIAKGLLALGSVAREPLWLFYRSDRPLTRVNELAGRRIAVGAEGSGTRPVAMQVIVANGLDPEVSPTDILSIGGRDAIKGLQDGSLDAAFFVMSVESPRIQQLLQDDRLRLMSFDRAAAYLRQYPWLTRVDVPRGLFSLSKDRPTTDITLLAPSTMLVVRDDIHPDLIPLLLEAARRTHRDGDLLSAPNEFPSPNHVDLPLDKDARRYLEKGPSWLYRVMPYRVAVQVDRLKILLLPLLTLMFPLFKIAPPLYRWRIRARVFRWYGTLSELDARLSSSPSGDEVDECRQTLQSLEHELARVKVPLSYMAEYYNLRMHVDLVRKRLEGVG